ncbi:unnamed protein product [Cylindrotheca closterium]|uniref:RWD domain-containing protein n=1 Tax=Cylindrotheca closterium TaxID=2856 RepID=A0AAD2FUX0_9STRA|nr:unnamed protein product [Cylindrotheca closterium]
METADAVRQVEEILNLQDRWFAKDGGVTIQTPALFSRLQKVAGNASNMSSNKRLEVKKQLALDIDCSILHPDDLSDMILEVEFPSNYPSTSPCHVRAVKASNRESEYVPCSAAIEAYLQPFAGCECIDMLLDWLSDNKSTCLSKGPGGGDISGGRNDHEGQALCYLLRYNHLLSGPEHKKEKAMIAAAKKFQLQGGLLWGTPGLVVVVPPSTEEDAKEYASECRTIGKRADGPNEVWLPQSGLDEAGMGGLAQQKRGGKLQELDTAGLRIGCGGNESLLKQLLGVS